MSMVFVYISGGSLLFYFVLQKILFAKDMPGCQQEFSEDSLVELLPVYYKRLFPFGPFYRWLSYGNVDSRHFSNREFSFTLHDDIYLRYQAFSNQQQLEEAIKKKIPFKMDIGAVFSFPPSAHRQVSSGLVPLERELVFDIDLTDYDDVRKCCQGAEVCQKCWAYMSMACQILDTALRDDFGFSHLLWVFSGRRGIHCWVCDQSARVLTVPVRSAVAEYLQVVNGGEGRAKTVTLPNSDRIHSSIQRAIGVIEPKFGQLVVQSQGLFDSPESIKQFLSLMDEPIRSEVSSIIQKDTQALEKWEQIKSYLKDRSGDDYRKRKILYAEILLHYCYPRLDIQVTKGMNHLLKAPFCVHPKTGKICVPFNPKTAEGFNPLTVPTINTLIEEVNNYDKELEEQLEKEGDMEGTVRSRIKDYKKTSLNKSMMVFEEFVRSLEQTWKGKHIKIGQSDNTMDF